MRVLLREARRAASIREIRLHQFRQSLGDVRLVRDDIARLAQVLGEVVKLTHAILFEDQFPRALPDGEITRDGLMHGSFAHWRSGCAEQIGQNAHAVLSSVRGQFCAGNFGSGGHEVVEADDIGAG